LTSVKLIHPSQYKTCAPSVRLAAAHFPIMSHFRARTCADSVASVAASQFGPRSSIMPKPLPSLARSPNLPGAIQTGDMSTCHNVKGVATSNGDLNNTSAARVSRRPKIDPVFAYRSLAIPITTDDELVRQKYRPFLLEPAVESSDWVSRLELATATKMAHYDIERTSERLRVLVLFGSLRKRYVHLSSQYI
jgi:hypothetical protein